jgi:hypothetical protein
MSTVHEDFTRAAGRKGGSDRGFGFVISAALLIFGLSPLRHGRPVRLSLLVSAAILLCIALVRPSLLRIPNRLWTKLGALLGKIVSPVVSALLFWLVFTPFAVVLRWMGKDPLGISFNRSASTYWVPRDRSETPPGMTSQF